MKSLGDLFNDMDGLVIGYLGEDVLLEDQE